MLKKSKKASSKKTKKPRTDKKQKPLFVRSFLCACAIALSVFVVAVLYRNHVTDITRSASHYFNKPVSILAHYRDMFSKHTWYAELYFSDETSDSLVREFRMLSSSPSDESKAGALISALIDGPEGNSVRTIPATVTLRDLYFSQADLIVVDFSSDLSDKHPGGSSSEILTVFSIVNTLVQNIDKCRKVQILIEGQPAHTIAGHLRTIDPFYADMTIVK